MKKGKTHMVMNLSMMIGVLCIVYFFIYIVFAGTTNLFTYFWLIVGAGCLVGRRLLEYMEQNSIVFPAIVKWIAGIVLGAVFLLIIVTEVVIIRYGAMKPSGGADYLLVLGAQVKGEEPSYALVTRLDAAYEYLEDNPDTIVILSGGRGLGEDVTEAHAMAEYLIEKGVKEEQMLLEEQSTNTFENINYSKELMENTDTSVVLVTNRFHVFRGMGVAKKQGLSNVEGLGSPIKWYTVPNQYLREGIAVIKYVLCGQI